MSLDPFLMHKVTALDLDSPESCNNGKDIPLKTFLTEWNESDIISYLSSSASDIEAKDRAGNTLLLRALLCHFDSAVDLLLKKEVNVNAKSSNHTTPLHAAVLEGNEKYINALIEKGADINAKDVYGTTPLIGAVKKNSELAVRLLVARHCDVNASNNCGNSPLHIAIRRGFWKTAEILLANGSNLAQQNKFGLTPLHIAASKGKSKGKSITENDAPIGMQDNLGESTEDSVNNCISICELLLAKDEIENSKFINIKTIRGKTALHTAAECYLNCDIAIMSKKEKQYYVDLQPVYKESCKILLAKGASVNEKDQDGNFPIHIAVKGVSTELLKIILDSGADVNSINKCDKTALQIAMEHSMNFEEHCNMLVSYGANVNIWDYKRQTPLHIAAKEGLENLWPLLIDNGADIYAKNTYGNSPLHIVSESGSSKFLSYILHNYTCLNHKNNQGKTALHIAASSVKEAEQKCELLLGRGADVNAKDIFDRTPIYFAFSKGHQSVCKILINKGVNINKVNSEESFLIHLATKNRCSEEIKCLLDKGTDINQKDSIGATALHYALGKCRVSGDPMCKFLLDRGADVTARDNEYRTPLHWATQCLSLSTVRLLLEAGADVNVQDRMGQTPMHMLNDKICSIEITEQHKYDINDILKELLEWGALSTIKDNAGSLSLHYILRVLSFGNTYPLTPIMSRIIGNHMTKCKSANIYTDLEHLILFDIVYEDFKIPCSAELAVLKNTMYGQHSLLDVFSQYSDPTYLANCKLEAAIASDEMLKFPIYGTLLKVTYIRAKERVKLLHRTQDILEMPLPKEMVWNILSYLGDSDLENIIKVQQLANCAY